MRRWQLNRRGSAKTLTIIGLIVGIIVGATVNASAFADKKSDKSPVGMDVYKRLFQKNRSGESEQKRARPNTSVMGVRGLDDDADAGQKMMATANMRAVYEMEDRSPSARTVEELRLHLSKFGAEKKPARLENLAITPADFEAEIDLGRKMAAQILGANKSLNHPRVLDYLLAITSLLSESGLSTDRLFRITVIDSQRINAFACPGGYIFITRGALLSARNEDQLAAMIGHEIAHISQRHLIASLQKRFAKADNKKMETPSDPHLSARKRIRPQASGEQDNWTRVLGPKGVGLTLMQASSEALDTLLSKGLEREFELEADRMGQHISTAAGYDARGLLSLFGELNSSKSKSVVSASLTHPPYDVRIENLSTYVQKALNQFTGSPGSSSLFHEIQRELSKL